MKCYTAIALEGFPLIKEGDNVAKEIVEVAARNNVKLGNGDVVAIAQKIISKAEKRVIDLRKVIPSEKARKIGAKVAKNPKFVELVLNESSRILKATSDILLVEDKRGLICINAGIDKSNVEGSANFALLPQNPDRSAKECRQEMRRITGCNVAVIICDTYSRPFRRGQVNFSIGMAGLRPLKDYRTKKDLFGQVLKVKNVAIVDEIAAAAELLMGQAEEARPVVIFKGLTETVEPCVDCRTSDLFISNQEDLFAGTL
jgi:coenzyme F420-0:L-glutamate ligase/coenzyme F420-1:gamma-L-glutamate ligase